jgi:hypothetical protein
MYGWVEQQSDAAKFTNYIIYVSLNHYVLLFIFINEFTTQAHV